VVIVEMVEASTPAAGEFLEVLVVFVVVVGLWFHWGYSSPPDQKNKEDSDH
jgi:hypothetical protein